MGSSNDGPFPSGYRTRSSCRKSRSVNSRTNRYDVSTITTVECFPPALVSSIAMTSRSVFVVRMRLPQGAITCCTRTSFLPRDPPGWKLANVLMEYRRPLSSSNRHSANASPSASIAVVVFVGTTLNEQASAMSPIDRMASAYRERLEFAFPVINRNLAPQNGLSTYSSSDELSSIRNVGTLRPFAICESSGPSPLLLRAITTSRLVILPMSPCNASALWRKNDGRPVDARVAEIFCAMSPDLPIPVRMTCPRHWCIIRIKGMNVSMERRAETVRRLCASAFKMSRARPTIAAEVRGVKSASRSHSGGSDFASSAVSLSGGVSAGLMPKNSGAE